MKPPIAFMSSNQRYSNCVVSSPMLEIGYIQWADEFGPVLAQQGYRRLWFHNPGGLHWKGFHKPDSHATDDAFRQAVARGVDIREMWIDQWILAEACGVRQAVREELRAAHMILLEKYGIEEITYYLGSPETLRDPVKEGMACIEPFLNLPCTTLAYDHTYTSRESKQHFWRSKETQRDKEITKFIKAQKKTGVGRVLVEARECHEMPKGVVDGTVARERYDKRNPEHLERSFEFGEVIRINFFGQDANYPVADEMSDPKTWKTGITPLVANWKTVKAAEVTQA